MAPRLTKAQKEEHRMWVNLNEFRKQFFTHTLPENVKNVLDECNYLTKWTDDPIVWSSKEEHRQAIILRIANSKEKEGL